MASELLINYRPYETRIALMENSLLVEFQLERGAQGAGILGNIYLGNIIRVLPGLQAAFVDIGMDKAAFLYVDDVFDGEKEFSRLMGNQANEGEEDSHPSDSEELKVDNIPHLSVNKPDKPVSQPIETLLSEGQEILVQVSKEPIGQKGARVTTHISIPGRRLVLMSKVNHLGISRRIEDEDERKRLREVLETIPINHGFIARTAAEGATEYEIKAEASFLSQLWQKIQSDKSQLTAPALVHQELDATLKAVRDLFSDQVDRLVIDDPH
ncbi:MAG: ribonuclease E/G, partial [Deltaproteobacteria bacterium]|nr:ribonuclease E/G [Deltaproteobacteria bacterium]